MHEKFSSYIIGEGTLLIQCADILLSRGHEIYGIISANPTIAQWAQNMGIRVIAPRPKDALIAALSEKPFDYFFSIANLSIIPGDILRLPGKSAINFHDGPLPRYSGLNATNWALLNQENKHGVSWHVMLDQVDAGDILKQQSIDIAPGETAFTLNTKTYETAIATFGELVDELAAGTVQPRQHQLDPTTKFLKDDRPRAAAVIDWRADAESTAALVRALDFGPVPNPLARPKLIIGGQAYTVQEIEVLEAPSSAAPGTLTRISEDVLQVATGSAEVRIRKLSTIGGAPVSVADLAAEHNLREGSRLGDLSPEAFNMLTTLNGALAKHETFWLNRLAALETIEPPYANRSSEQFTGSGYATLPMNIPAQVATFAASKGLRPADFLLVAFNAYMARISGSTSFDVGFSDPALRHDIAEFEMFFATYVPLRVKLNAQDSLDAVLNQLSEGLAKVRERKTYTRDLTNRYAELGVLQAAQGIPTYAVIAEQVLDPATYNAPAGAELALVLTPDGTACDWVYQTPLLDADSVAAMQHQFITFLNAMMNTPQRAFAETLLLTDAEYQQMITEWNATETDYPAHVCIHHLFEAQAAKTPDAIAVVFEDQHITYADLNSAANQLGRYLQSLGVGADVRVGIYMERSIDLMVGLLGILKAGGAYVPLDPTYPEDRIAFMIQDAQAPVLLTQQHLTNRLPQHSAQVVAVDGDWDRIAQESDENFDSGVQSHHLSYLIYTSGSTGLPKGVMIEHRNVINFFVGMDERLGYDGTPGTWLAVTSLSFDISVLELFWTLTRGFKVVLYGDSEKSAAISENGAAAAPHVDRQIDFSLFYFASDEGENVADKYELLLEGVKYADQNGFSAVWTPERHFGAFGGLYPNPSVASAAIAAITKNIKIRAGSCVSPLHSPIRIAEEWALVDNLSKGRVGISFAAGWQPNDFVLMPANFADRKNGMFRDIETIHRLWRGETVDFPGHDGKPVPVHTLPRPVQPELPTWITIAGNPETFQMAGAGGYHILTHLLGQSVEELAGKIAAYRQAWHDAGHPGEGHITLMLHTFVGKDNDEVREIVREPMKAYLRSALNLIRAAAWSFPAFKDRAQSSGKNPMEIFDSQDFTPEEMDALLEHAFERYFETSGLFGTPETCLKMVNKLKAMGVTEIGCLIDFGVPSPTVLRMLVDLNLLRGLATLPASEQVADTAELQHLYDLARLASPSADYSIPAQIKRHNVTHFQCTPSMAAMLLVDDDTRAAFKSLQKLMIGGEAFPAAMANELTELVAGEVINMYGPTETTIWSSTYQLNGEQGVVPIGRPIANTQLYVLDKYMQPVPAGIPGELFIGGDGVVRGYLDRPQLNAERFIADPFSAKPGARLYRTGDVARYRADGSVEFLGRNDHQVKIRGYRIELGEIEKLLDQHPEVSASVVIAREDTPGDKRLVAYLISRSGQKLASAPLRDHLSETLPDFMIPAHFITLDAFPLTPNKKTDRKALPAPSEVAAVESAAAYVAPQDELEEKVALILQETLGAARVSMSDSFLDLGGNSILAVVVNRRLSEVAPKKPSVADLFRFNTIGALVEYLKGDQQADVQATVQQAEKSKSLREQQLIRRQGLRNPR